jgi:hypothetical protein
MKRGNKKWKTLLQSNKLLPAFPRKISVALFNLYTIRLQTYTICQSYHILTAHHGKNQSLRWAVIIYFTDKPSQNQHNHEFTNAVKQSEWKTSKGLSISNQPTSILSFWERTYYSSTDSLYFTFVTHNFKISQSLHL